MVQATPLPIVTVTGISSSHYGYESLRSGVHLFPDVRIEVTNADDSVDSSSEEDESSEEEDLINVSQRVDSCTATVYPPLNPDHETLSWPEKLMRQLNIDAKFSHDGVTLTGGESTNHYEQVLSFSLIIHPFTATDLFYYNCYTIILIYPFLIDLEICFSLIDRFYTKFIDSPNLKKKKNCNITRGFT